MEKVSSVFEKDIDSIMSSVVEYIQNTPRIVRDKNGSLINFDDDDRIKKIKQEAINLIRNATEYRIDRFHNVIINDVFCLILSFNNTFYSEYCHKFHMWNENSQKCDIFQRINHGFQTAIQGFFYGDGKVETKIKGVFIPQDKGFHKIEPTSQFYIDELKKAKNEFKSIPFATVCNQLINSLENESYEEIIDKTRSLIESYHKHLLNVDKIDNKLVLKQVLSQIEIIPEELQQKDKKISANVETIINSLDSIMASLAALRNNPLVSLSHGSGSCAIYLRESHAYLMVGSALSYMNFINKSKYIKDSEV